jgi:metallo-beta-lactamase family protein
MRLTFLGGAGTVTGSKTVVETSGARVLVDCGLFQGFKHLRLKNRAAPTFAPATLDAIVLTHAHLDHSGWLPVVVRAGFRGPIWCTAGTRDLAAILLRDAGKLEQEQADWLRKKKKSKHDPPTPLFTIDDADRAIDRLVAVRDGDVTVAPGVVARFTPVGHIIGASSIHLASGEHSIVFSGDVGRPHDTLLRAPAIPPPADTLVLESTYGGRRHPRESPRLVLADILRRTIERGGIVIVPAFAVGRAQAVLHLVRELMDEGAIPRVPVFLNSPMASAVTDATLAHAHELAIDAASCRARGARAVRQDTTER